MIEGEAVTLVNGVAEKELAPGSASKQVTSYFGNEAAIDLNSDGLMEFGLSLNPGQRRQRNFLLCRSGSQWKRGLHGH